MKQAGSPIYNNIYILGNITKIVSPSADEGGEDAASEARLVRFALQSEARAWLPDERVANCLRSLHAATVDVYYSPLHVSAHYGGLLVCGSVWQCAVCAAKISTRKREDLEHALLRCNERGIAVYMTTYTVSHQRFDRLAVLLQVFLEARRRCKQGKHIQQVKQRFGLLGTVSVLETTWSTLNGWHPHVHELVFSGNPAIEVDEFETVLRRQWKRKAEDQGLQMDSHGFRLDRTYGAVADYIAKFGHEPIKTPWGVESEMTKGHLKRGRGPIEHYTPFGLLYQVFQGQEEWGPVFVEYARRFKHRKQLSWSKGLRKLLLGKEEEKTDEELATEYVEDAVLLGRLTRQQWRVVLANDARGELLEVARSGDWQEVQAFLTAIGCEVADEEVIQRE